MTHRAHFADFSEVLPVAHYLTLGHMLCYKCPTLEATTTRSELLALRVCEARDAAGLTNRELAIRSGVPRRTIVRITNGHNKSRINTETLEAIAQATGLPVSFFSDPSSRVLAAAELLVAALVDELRSTLAREKEAVA